MKERGSGGDQKLFFESSRQIWEEELKVIRKRRKRIVGEGGETKDPSEEHTDPRYTAIGLSLSGGGIRSGLFNLGILQGLSRLGILRLVDVLSTVSGGGYIGGCLSAILSIKDPGDSILKDDKAFTFWGNESPLFSTE